MKRINIKKPKYKIGDSVITSISVCSNTEPSFIFKMFRVVGAYYNYDNIWRYDLKDNDTEIIGIKETDIFI